VALLEAGLAELERDPAPAAALARLATLLDRWAGRMSLTAHRSPEAIARRLILDAAALEGRLPSAEPPESLVDLGSGPGFPGLPLAILGPHRSVTLVEARERPHHFQRAAIRELGIGNVRALRGRAEELEASPHAIAVAQAMAAPERAARLLLPWVRPGGWLAVPGGPEPPLIPRLVGLGPPEVRPYRVPLGGPPRTLWLARRDPS
jgi:16S rRNA (guanine527-N7)-methyltransferase